MTNSKNSFIYIVYLFFEDDYRVWPHSEILDSLVSADPRVILIGVTYPISFFTLLINPKRFFKHIFKRSDRVGDKIYSFTPLSFLPMDWINRSRFAAEMHRGWFNRQIGSFFKKMAFSGPIVSWFYCINAFPLWSKIPRSELLVYDCRDDFVHEGDREVSELKTREERLLAAADLVFFSSRHLLEIKGGKAKKCFYYSNGVDFKFFEKAKNATSPVDPELGKIKKPIVGFLGITRPLVDLDLVGYLAREMPTVSFVFVGPIVAYSRTDVRNLQRRHANIHFLAPRKKEELRPVLNAFDIGILPYKQNIFYESTNALKLWQYLASGLPMLCASAPEYLPYHELISLYSTKEEALKKLKVLLNAPADDLVSDRIALARRHDWKVICKDTLERVTECIGQ